MAERAPPQPTHREIDIFASQMEPTFNRLSREIRKRVNAGQSVDEAVRLSVAEIGLGVILTDRIVNRSVKIVERVINIDQLDDEVGFRKFWLNNFWSGDDLKLSNRISDLTRLADIKSTIKESLKQAKSWTGLASALGKQNLQKADLASHITQLDAQARRLMRGDKTGFREFQRDIRQSMRKVERLAQAEAPTQRLKKSYQNVINVSRGTSEQALNKAMDRAIRAKSRFNSERIARTEIAKAYSQGQYQGAIDDPDVVGIRYRLSSRHAQFDICDFNTEANLFGLGKGVYPLNKLPRYPFHPHCTCVMSYVFEGETKQQVNKGAIRFINGLSDKRQKSILGVQGAKNFKRSNSKWRDELRGFERHRDINTLREIKGLKAA